MASCTSIRCGRTWFFAGVIAVSGGCFAVARAATRHASQKVARLSPWDAAEQRLEAFEALTQAERTRAEFGRVMDGFRAVYHDSPRDVHAAASVNAVAHLLEEQGRELGDAKSSKAAIGQFEFLRLQYPGSSLRVAALMAEGQIYAEDLGDAKAARERFELLVKLYPGSGMAEQARAALKGQGSGDKGQALAGVAAGSGSVTGAAQQVGAEGSVAGMKRSAGAGRAEEAGTAPSGWVSSDPAEDERSAAKSTAAGSAVTGAPVSTAAGGRGGTERGGTGRGGTKGKLAQVTGIRHWSTRDYTRVAIDLGDEVTYEAARVPNPDRIYFDLHGTRLARELVGKSFAVTDDGFLKKVRAAQFSDDMTRVVLDVNDVTEYSAFLLPNPYRLIIDIHGPKAPATRRAQGPTVESGGMTGGVATKPATVAAVPEPRVETTTKPTTGRPVPNTVETRNAAAATDVAAVSAQPGRVEATSVPTSKPISAVVKDKDKSAGAQSSVTGEPGGAGEVASGAAAPSGRSGRRRAGTKGAKAPAEAAEPARAAVPTADGETSLVRALGLKIGRIVIDAGHGGHDSGTLGVDGLEEKDVVLDVALRVGKLLHDRLGAEVVYTRSDDTFIPLETRTAIANKAQADLFLSIHANSSSDASARGVETYYLNFTSAPDSLKVAARENAVSDQSIHQLSDLVKKIALQEKIDESREFASDVEQSLYGGLERGNAGLKNRGVKKAPFVVLIGANMPSILAEISFVTNPKDANQLRQPEYRERVAESLYKGVAKYAGGLSGVKGFTEQASLKGQ